MRNIAWTQILSLYTDSKILLLHTGLGIIQRRLLTFLPKYSRHLSGNTVNTLTIRAVRCNCNVKDPVIQTKHRLYIRSHRRILRKNQKSVVAGARIQVLVQPQLSSGTEHSEGLITAKLSLLDGHDALNGHMVFCGRINSCSNQRQRILSTGMDIVCATADLKGSVFPGIHLTQT